MSFQIGTHDDRMFPRPYMPKQWMHIGVPHHAQAYCPIGYTDLAFFSIAQGRQRMGQGRCPVPPY